MVEIRGPQTEAQLEDYLSRPSPADAGFMRALTGDVMVLGAGGKMGPSLARRIRRSAEAAGVRCRVIAVSRFSSSAARESLEQSGVETVPCDLLDRRAVESLPDCANVLFLAGRKFGSTDRVDLTWAINSWVPGLVAERYRSSRIVVFSTGNVYRFVPLSSSGSVESDTPGPVGEYAQSCLGRERVFEFFSAEHGLRCVFYRLNYAIDLRYGVMVDIARRVLNGEPVPLSVPRFNVIWQGDANSYAMRSLALCTTPATPLNVTGLGVRSVRVEAEWFGQRLGRKVSFAGEEGEAALLSDASRCHSLLGPPDVSFETLREWVAQWVEIGGATLGKPTRFEVKDGRF
jgi:nucleoside-diphosphate-sugar epimerase